MIKRHQFPDFTWLDAREPSQKEVRAFVEEFDLEPEMATDLLLPTHASSLRSSEQTIYTALHFPARRHTHNDDQLQEIDIIIGPGLLLTNHYEEIDALHKLRKVIHTGADDDSLHHPVELLYVLLQKMYRSINHELNNLRDELKEEERELFVGREIGKVTKLSQISLDLTNILLTLESHLIIVENLSGLIPSMYGKKWRPMCEKIPQMLHSTLDQTKTLRTYIDELRKTNDILLSSRQNQLVTRLTVFAFIMFPLTFFTQVFGMNTINMPLVGQTYDFWLVLLLATGFSALLYLVFKLQKWL